jgi:hypothetical protein
LSCFESDESLILLEFNFFAFTCKYAGLKDRGVAVSVVKLDPLKVLKRMRAVNDNFPYDSANWSNPSFLPAIWVYFINQVGSFTVVAHYDIQANNCRVVP